jgi:uncharacterized tellurite resistance protein B-like protein
MSILEWFRSLAAPDAPVHGDTETVRRIVAQLDALEPRRARYLAAFAYVLGRVANADLDISDVETTRMIDLVQSVGHLPEEQAILVVTIAKSQNRLFGGTENFLVTREFRAIASDDERRGLLDCLFSVAAADDAISGEEDAQIRQIAGELGFAHDEFVQVRMRYSDKRTVFSRDKA